jgi:acetate kinase
VGDHGKATVHAIEWLEPTVLLDTGRIEAVGHIMIVYGGDRRVEPTLLNDEVVEAIEALAELAGDHAATTGRAGTCPRR